MRFLLLLISTGFAHALLLSRRAHRKRVFYMRKQRASLVANIFLVMIMYHKHGQHVVAANTWLLMNALIVPGWSVVSLSVDSVIAPIVSW